MQHSSRGHYLQSGDAYKLVIAYHASFFVVVFCSRATQYRSSSWYDLRQGPLTGCEMSRTRYKTALLIHCGSDIICRETYHIMTLCTSNTCSHSCHVPLARTAASHSLPNRPWASLYPPPLAGGFYPMVISGYLDHQSTQFMLSASELLLFVSMVLVLINALYGIPNCDDLVS